MSQSALSHPPAIEVHTCGMGEQLPFLLRLERDPGLAVLTINGELDIAVAAELDEAVAALNADRPEEILVDLSGLSFIDCSGIQALLRATAICKDRDCHLVFLRGSAQVQRALTLAGVLDRFRFAD